MRRPAHPPRSKEESESAWGEGGNECPAARQQGRPLRSTRTPIPRVQTARVCGSRPPVWVAATRPSAEEQGSCGRPKVTRAPAGGDRSQTGEAGGAERQCGNTPASLRDWQHGCWLLRCYGGIPRVISWVELHSGGTRTRLLPRGCQAEAVGTGGSDHSPSQTVTDQLGGGVGDPDGA